MVPPSSSSSSFTGTYGGIVCVVGQQKEAPERARERDRLNE